MYFTQVFQCWPLQNVNTMFCAPFPDRQKWCPCVVKPVTAAPWSVLIQGRFLQKPVGTTMKWRDNDNRAKWFAQVGSLQLVLLVARHKSQRYVQKTTNVRALKRAGTLEKESQDNFGVFWPKIRQNRRMFLRSHSCARRTIVYISSGRPREHSVLCARVWWHNLL